MSDQATDYKALIEEVRGLFDEGWCVCRSSHLPGDLLAAIEDLVEMQAERDALRAQLDAVAEGFGEDAPAWLRPILAGVEVTDHD